MAIVSDGWNLVVGFVDTGANTTTRSYDLVAADAAEAATASAAVLAALANVTDATITGYTVGEKFIEQSYVLPAAAEVENQAQISLMIFQQPNKRGILTIPAPKPAIFEELSGDGFNRVDFSDNAVIAFRALFVTGGDATISDGEVGTTVNSKGKRIHSKSNRG